MCPIKSVCDKTLEEAWSGRRPLIQYLIIFGCITYVHVPDQLRKKLDYKGNKCIFISYGTNEKTYKFYNPITKKVVISRYVTFNEEGMCDWFYKAQKKVAIIPKSYEDKNDHVDQH